MLLVVKRFPRTTIRAPPPDIFCPSISSDTTFQVPCNRSRSCPMDAIPSSPTSNYNRNASEANAFLSTRFHKHGRVFRGNRSLTVAAPIRAARSSLCVPCVFARNVFLRLPARLVHTVEDFRAVGIHPARPAPQGRRDQRSQTRRLLAIYPGRRKAVPDSRRRFRAVDARAPFDDIQVQFEDAPLGQYPIGQRGQRELHPFSQHAPAGCKK